MRLRCLYGPVLGKYPPPVCRFRAAPVRKRSFRTEENRSLISKGRLGRLFRDGGLHFLVHRRLDVDQGMADSGQALRVPDHQVPARYELSGQLVHERFLRRAVEVD